MSNDTSSFDSFTRNNLYATLVRAQHVNQLHRSTLEALPGLSVDAKKVLWAILNEQDAWPPHLAGSCEGSPPQPVVWIEQEEWSLLTIRRIMGLSSLSCRAIGENFFPHHSREGTKTHWKEMMERDVGWETLNDRHLEQLVRETHGLDVQLVARGYRFGRDRLTRFDRVALGTQSVCQQHN